MGDEPRPEGAAVDLGLRGRSGIVTGGAGGLGRAIAAALYGDGANVVISGRTPETLESAAEAITSGSSGGSVSAIPVDTRDDQSVAAMVDRTIATHGRIDFLVNCAARP